MNKPGHLAKQIEIEISNLYWHANSALYSVYTNMGRGSSLGILCFALFWERRLMSSIVPMLIKTVVLTLCYHCVPSCNNLNLIILIKIQHKLNDFQILAEDLKIARLQQIRNRLEQNESSTRALSQTATHTHQTSNDMNLINEIIL